MKLLKNIIHNGYKYIQFDIKLVEIKIKDKMNKNVENFNETQNQKLGISDVMHSDYQQKVFKEIVDMKHRMQGLAGFVQCDFERMLEDGTITKDDIKEVIEDMDKSFDKTINEINTLREKCRVIMSYHCS